MTGPQIQLFVDRTGAGYNWRLLAANNRETGRGTSLHLDERACRDEIRRLQCASHRLVARARRASLGRWSWELALDDVVVAASTHTFDRMIRCEQVVATVAARLAAAPIAAGVIDSGLRRRTASIRPTPRLGEFV